LVSELFEEYKIEIEKTEPITEEVAQTVTEEVVDESILDLTKLKKDELISLVKTAFPDRDYNGLKKDELIEILEGPTNA